MKKLLAALVAASTLALPLASARADPPPPLTADFYLLEPEKYVDKNVSINVARVESSSLRDEGDGNRSINAHTMNNLNDGGWIRIVAKPDVLTRVITLCGTAKREFYESYHPRIIQGKFIRHGSKFAVLIEK